MVSKRKTKTTFSEIMMLLTVGGAILIGSLLRLFVFGIGLLLVIAGLFTPETTLFVKSLLVIGGLAVVALMMFFKYVCTWVFVGLSNNPSDLRKRIVTYCVVGVSIVAVFAVLPGALYWTSQAVSATGIKNTNTKVVGSATQQDWQYPLMIVPWGNTFGIGRSSLTDQQALVRYDVRGQQYSTSTMVHMPIPPTQKVDLYYDPVNPARAVSWTLWNASVMQAVIFDVMTVVCALGSGFLATAVMRDRNFLYKKSTHSSRRKGVAKPKRK